jgi:FMN phosphatase YigB (HAD superfamily)
MYKLKNIKKDKIVIFDLDDTLVRTNAKVKIIDSKTHEIIKELTPEQFNNFVKKKHHIMDYDDFDNPSLLRQGKIIHEIFEIFKKSYHEGIPVAVLTARSDSDLVRNFFLENGIDIHPDLVIAINDPQFKYKGSIAERKKKAIKDLIDSGYKKLTFFDDNEENIKLAQSVSGYKGSNIITIHV